MFMSPWLKPSKIPVTVAKPDEVKSLPQMQSGLRLESSQTLPTHNDLYCFSLASNTYYKKNVFTDK